ncbi:16693_t:CDS:2, partial [Dentiscutata heterogama]
NEPPIVDYQYPIIGHTWSFTTNCKKLISESRKKYGETFSLYIFGQVITITGKEMGFEVFNKHNEFSFYRGTDTHLVMDYVLPYAAMNIDKTAKIFRTFFKRNIGNITDLLQQNISNSIENYIGECVEPKVISIPYNVFLKIFSRVSTNIIIDDECSQYEEVIDLFENFTNLVVS